MRYARPRGTTRQALTVHSPRRTRPRHRGVRPGHADWPRDGSAPLHGDAIDVTDIDALTNEHDTDGHPDQAANEEADEADEDGKTERAPTGAGRRHPATGRLRPEGPRHAGPAQADRLVLR